MAPVVADAPVFSQKQARRPVARIVPAIPHRLSRTQPSVRPITPEESSKGTVPQSEPAPQAPPEKQTEELSNHQQVGAVETPLTPDSRVSVADKSEGGGPVRASSPASSPHGHIEQVAESQDVRANGHSNGASITPSTSRTEVKPIVNGLYRKLTIPTELPPPFYPSNRADTQTSPVQALQLPDAQSHRPQLSAGAIVFQSAHESPAQPATPQDIESDPRAQPQTLPRPVSNYAPQQVAPFFPGHSHHPSNSGAPWLQPRYPVAPADPVFENGGDYRSPQYSLGPTGYSTPYSNHFTPRDASFPINGTSPSHNHSPSKSQSGEVKPTSDHGEEQLTVPYRNDSGSHAERLEESPFELAGYLSTQFGNLEFADFILQVRSPEAVLVSIPVHGIIVARSPVIAEATRQSSAPGHRSRDSRRLIEIHVLNRYATHESLEEAIKVLYGAPLLSPQTFLFGLGPYVYESSQSTSSSDARRRMQQVLSYIAAAKTLQMPSMQARGVEIARMLLRWDTIEQVIQYGLEPATSGSRSQIEGPGTDDPFIVALLNYVVDFMAFTFPVDFNLYTLASELQKAPRLPTLVEPKQATHNPRLSKIRFGDAPPEHDLQPNHAARVLSSILMSLPAPFIERLFNHRATANQIGWTGAVRILREVIAERENRRFKALRSQLKPPHDGTLSATLVDNIYIEESVEQIEPTSLYPSGHRIATKRVPGEV